MKTAIQERNARYLARSKARKSRQTAHQAQIDVLCWIEQDRNHSIQSSVAALEHEIIKRNKVVRPSGDFSGYIGRTRYLYSR